MGKPNKEDLLLGAGELFFRRLDADGNPIGGFLHMGNMDTLEITTNDDVLTKRSNMTRARPVRKRVTRSREVILRAVGDEFNPDNLALIFMGSVAYATDAGTGVVDKVMHENLGAGTLGSQLGGQFFHVGAVNIDTVSMKVGSTSLDADDFEVYDAAMGFIYIKPDAPTVAVSGDDLLVSYTPETITGKESPIVRGGTETEIQGQVLYKTDNTSGRNGILRVWNVSVAPDGAVGLISDEWGSFALNMTIQDDSVGRYGGTEDDPLYHFQMLPRAA
jgi:hypothetical protein